MAGSVFISYSRQDREFVEKLAVRLREAGLDVWYDIEVEVGEDFADVLEKQIERCDAFIVVLTPAAASAKWVRREIRFAERFGKKPLPIMLKECVLPIDLALVHFERIAPSGMVSDRFVEQVRRSVGPEPEPVGEMRFDGWGRTPDGAVDGR